MALGTSVGGGIVGVYTAGVGADVREGAIVIWKGEFFFERNKKKKKKRKEKEKEEKESKPPIQKAESSSWHPLPHHLHPSSK